MTRYLSFLLLAATAIVPHDAVAQSGSWPDGAWVRGQHVLIQFTGVLHAPRGLERTKEDARRRAMEVIARATAGESFDSLAKEYTDDPTGAASNGDLGRVSPGALAPELEQALLQLREGEVSKTPVQTVFGFHVVRRLPSEPRLVIRHILIAYAGALRAPEGIKRTRDEAKALAAEVTSKLGDGADFAELAKIISDDPATAPKGGLLGELQPGIALPAIQSAAGALDPGDVSAVVETPFGFHVLERDKTP